VNIQERAHLNVLNAQKANFPIKSVLQTVIIVQQEHFHHQKVQLHVQFVQKGHILLMDQAIANIAQQDNFLQKIHLSVIHAL
jgi:hypothetical protein